MRRELRSVRTEEVLGAVDDHAEPVFQGSAGNVLSAMRRKIGDAATAREVMRDGWSNGYLYFADLITP
jgi:hypothetical protein